MTEVEGRIERYHSPGKWRRLIQPLGELCVDSPVGTVCIRGLSTWKIRMKSFITACLI